MSTSVILYVQLLYNIFNCVSTNYTNLYEKRVNFYIIHNILIVAYNEETPTITGVYSQKGETTMAQYPDNGSAPSPLPFRSHTAHLLATALPFLQPEYRHPVELITKFLEFSETIKLYQEFHTKNGNPFSGLFQELSHQGKEGGLFGLINTFIMDLEGLLQCLTQVCTGDEREIINMFLNIIRAKNFYETYGDLLHMGSLFSDGTPDFSTLFPSDTPTEPESASPQTSAPEASSSGVPFSGDLSSMLNSEQQETLNLLKNLFSND